MDGDGTEERKRACSQHGKDMQVQDSPGAAEGRERQKQLIRSRTEQCGELTMLEDD